MRVAVLLTTSFFILNRKITTAFRDNPLEPQSTLSLLWHFAGWSALRLSTLRGTSEVRCSHVFLPPDFCLSSSKERAENKFLHQNIPCIIKNSIPQAFPWMCIYLKTCINKSKNKARFWGRVAYTSNAIVLQRNQIRHVNTRWRRQEKTKTKRGIMKAGAIRATRGKERFSLRPLRQKPGLANKEISDLEVFIMHCIPEEKKWLHRKVQESLGSLSCISSSTTRDYNSHTWVDILHCCGFFTKLQCKNEQVCWAWCGARL